MLDYKYQDRDTVIHRLTPWSKLGWIASLVLLAVIFDHPVYLFLLFLSTIPVIAAARLTREWASLMKYCLFLCLAVVLINAIISQNGSHELVKAPFSIPLMGNLRITLEGIVCGVGNSLRLAAIISAFSVLILAIHPDDLMQGLIKMKLPYKSLLVASVSARFLPALLEDSRNIVAVQRSRGLEFSSGSKVQRTRNYMAIFIPLLSNSLERASQLAEVLESRGFGSKRRTFYKELKLTGSEIVVLISALLPGIFGIIIYSQGFGSYDYYPALEGIGFMGMEAICLIFLLFLATLVVFTALVKRRTEID